MLIKFKAPDPRAGTVAQMDSGRGHYFIEGGFADAVKEGAPAAATQVEPEQEKEKPEKAGKKGK